MTEDARVKDAAYWRERAKETRTITDTIREPNTKRIMDEIAASYDKLAEQAERLAQRNPGRRVRPARTDAPAETARRREADRDRPHPEIARPSCHKTGPIAPNLGWEAFLGGSPPATCRCPANAVPTWTRSTPSDGRWTRCPFSLDHPVWGPAARAGEIDARSLQRCPRTQHAWRGAGALQLTVNLIPQRRGFRFALRCAVWPVI
jgi:hypothetical protein